MKMFRANVFIDLIFSVPFHSYSTAAECGGSGSGSSNGAEKAGKAEGDAGPSCSSLSKDAGDGKSRFFDDSEESEEGEEEEGSDEEVIRLQQSKAWVRCCNLLLWYKIVI